MLGIILFLKYLKIYCAFHTQACPLLMQFIFFLFLKFIGRESTLLCWLVCFTADALSIFQKHKNSKNKILKPLQANDDVCIAWLRGKSHIQNVILLLLHIMILLAAYGCERGTVCLLGRHDPITQTCHLLCG